MELAAREGAHGFELDITLCKRPRESWINLTLQKPRSQSPTTEKTTEDQKKMVLDFKQKIQPDVLSRHSLNVSRFGSLFCVKRATLEQCSEKRAFGQLFGQPRPTQTKLTRGRKC